MKERKTHISKISPHNFPQILFDSSIVCLFLSDSDWGLRLVRGWVTSEVRPQPSSGNQVDLTNFGPNLHQRVFTKQQSWACIFWSLYTVKTQLPETVSRAPELLLSVASEHPRPREEPRHQLSFQAWVRHSPGDTEWPAAWRRALLSLFWTTRSNPISRVLFEG